MADGAYSSNTIIRPYRSALGAIQVRHFQESTCIATAVIKAGDIVSFDTVVTTGTLRIVRAPSSGGNGTNLLQVGVTSIVGVALENSTSDGSTTGLLANGAKGNSQIRQIAVAVADGFTEFLGYISTAGANGGVATSSLVGTNKAVIHNRTLGRWFVDSTNSTAALVGVTITDIPDWGDGDTNGPVVFKFLSSNVSPAVRIGGPSV